MKPDKKSSDLKDRINGTPSEDGSSGEIILSIATCPCSYLGHPRPPTAIVIGVEQDKWPDL
jgi:hypothetical protein